MKDRVKYIWKTGTHLSSFHSNYCTCIISHNAPFRIQMCTFLFSMVYCGMRTKCIVRFFRLVHSNSLKNPFHCNSIFGHRCIFCTCYDRQHSYCVMRKCLWRSRNFSHIWIATEKLLVKWAPGKQRYRTTKSLSTHMRPGQIYSAGFPNDAWSLIY